MILVHGRCALSFLRKMTTVSDSLEPVGVRGMKVLDKEKFRRTVTIPTLKVPQENLSKISRAIKNYFLKIENFKPVQNVDSQDENTYKCIHLSPLLVKSWDDIKESDRKDLYTCDVTKTNFNYKDLDLTYDNFKHEQIFKAVLPENEEGVSGFSQIGHIIHLNLRDHLLDYKKLIGQVLLDKIKLCKTVIIKNNNIDNTYRNFSMEVIAGEEQFVVAVKENTCTFELDFSKVYWNPRLCKEHERILSILKPGDVLFDIFCGVGPFAIPAAKRGIKVFANDLNPESFKWLNHNAKINKIKPNFFKAFNLDGKDFIKTEFKQFLTDICERKQIISDDATIHVTMNLPALAVEFLVNFKGLLEQYNLTENFKCKILVHVYCFAVGDNLEIAKEVAKQKVLEHIGVDISSDIINLFGVRNVSPKKEMIRVTFQLTKDVVFKNASDEPPVKKLCV